MASRAAILRAAQAAPGAAQPTYPPQGGSPWIGQLPSYGSEPGSGYSYSYGSFLPRPQQAFTEGAFGPFSPILPVPVDRPGPGLPRAQPRRWQYQVGWNLPVGQPGTEGHKLASFQTLRTLADTYSILRTCLERRKNEIRALNWQITLTPDAANAYQGDRAAMRDFGERKAEATKFFSRPDPNYFTFSSWLHAMMDQVFTLDALSLYMCPKKGKGMGRGLLGSDLDSLWLLDGSTIRPLLDLHGATPDPPAPGYQQFIYGVPRSDLATMAQGLDLAESGLTQKDIITELRGDQLIYYPYLQRPDSPYGMSLVEQCLIPIMTGLRRQAYQLDYFDESTVPRVYISPGDSTLTANQLRELQDALNATAGDLAWAFKIQVLPPGSKVMPQKEMSTVDDSDNWIATEVAMACCAMGTEILTRSGLKAIEDVRPGDQVMTHRGLWRPVTRVMRSPAGEKDVRRIAAHGFDPLEVTSDHPVWTARYHRQGTRARQYQGTEFLPAGKMRAAGPRGDFDTVTLPVPVMGSSDAVLRPADHVKGRGRYKVWEENGRLRHTRRDVQTLPAEVPMSAALGRILGFYMAEGSIGTSQVFWSFHEDEVAYQQMVIDDLWSVFGLRAKVKPKSDPATTGKVANVVCQSPLLRDLLSCGTATTKSLPGWAWDGPPEFYASLLWAWVAGDGWTASVTDGPTRTRFDGWRGYTASKTLAWQMRMVALACGHPCSFRLRKQPESSIRGRALRSDRGIYALEMRRKINPARPGWYQIESGQHLTSAVRSNDTASYDGDYVYNLEVAGDHSYVTTGGTVHNCDISPVEIGLLPKVSAAASPFAAREMAQASRSIHERTATAPTLSYISEIIDFILQVVCGQHDMRFVFEGMEQTQDLAALTDMGIKQVQSGVKTIDEFRDDLHMTRFNLPETRSPVVFTQLGPVPLGQAVANAETQVEASTQAVGEGHRAATGSPQRKALPAGTSGQGRMNGPVTQRQARRGGALAPAHATAEGAPGHSGGKPVPKAAAAELEALGRHLRKGMPAAEWVPEHIPGAVMEIIAEDLGKGLSAGYVISQAAASLGKAPAPQQQSQAQQRRQMAALSARYQAQVQAAFGSALTQAQGLIAAWAAGTLAVTAAVLALMIADLIREALLAVLTLLWTAAFDAGAKAAGGKPSQAELDAFLATEGRTWADLISGTGTAALIAAIRMAIAAGDPQAVAERLAQILDTANRSETIAVSEVTRAWNAGFFAVLRFLGVAYKTWITRNDGSVCPVCMANQDQGPVELGKPFLSGAMHPLQHPNCRCRVAPWSPPAQAGKVLRREVGLNGQETWTDWTPEPETTGGRVFQPHLSDGTEVPLGGVPGASAGGEPPRWDGSEPDPVVERSPDAEDDAEYGSASGTGSRPGAYWPAPYMDGWWPSPAGHGTGQPPTSSPGAANGRPPNAGGKAARDAAARFLKDAPKASPGAVRAVMRGNFPSSALRWVGKIRWAGPVDIPLELIESGGRDKWAARHQQGHVDQIAADAKAGKPGGPAILVLRDGHNHARLIDGRHRFEAMAKLGRPLRAYVGYLDAANEKAAYDTYLHQVHSGGSPENKSAAMEAFQDRGEPVRRRYGIDGTAGDAQDIPHAFWAAEPGDPSACLACGLRRDIPVHACRCCNGRGEHATGHECYRCDAGMYPSPREWDSPFCEKAVRDPAVHAEGCPVCGAGKSFTAGNLADGSASGLVPLAVEGQRQGAYCAGLAVRAADTGRVLMIQRAITDADPAAGKWEIPGGHAETGESLLAAAIREWSEETGRTLPHGQMTGRWESPNGVYEGFVLTIPREDGVPLGDPRRTVNPDGDSFEAVAWWDPGLLDGNPAVRPELLSDLPLLLAALRTDAAKSALTPMLSTTHNPLGPHSLWHTPDRHAVSRQSLPDYIENVAHALERDGHGESEAIALAIAAVKDWAQGHAFGGRVKVTPAVQAAAAAAVAEWEKLKESHHP